MSTQPWVEGEGICPWGLVQQKGGFRPWDFDFRVKRTSCYKVIKISYVSNLTLIII